MHIFPPTARIKNARETDNGFPVNSDGEWQAGEEFFRAVYMGTQLSLSLMSDKSGKKSLTFSCFYVFFLVIFVRERDDLLFSLLSYLLRKMWETACQVIRCNNSPLSIPRVAPNLVSFLAIISPNPTLGSHYILQRMTHFRCPEGKKELFPEQGEKGGRYLTDSQRSKI